MKPKVIVFSVLAIMMAVPTLAHHGRIGKFASERIQIVGVVSRFDWRNPHVYAYVETLDENGRTVEWMFENTSVSTMTRQGWTEDTLKVGDRITVEARPHTDPTKLHGSSATYIRTDGTRIGRPNSDIRNELLTSEARSEDLFGVWVGLLDTFNLTNPPTWAEDRTAVLIAGGNEFPNASEQEYAMEAVPTLNEKGRAALTQFDRDDLNNPWCTPWPVFPANPGRHPGGGPRRLDLYARLLRRRA